MRDGQEARGWVAKENQAQVETVFASGDDTTLDAIVLGWMESIGPIDVAESWLLVFICRPTRLMARCFGWKSRVKCSAANFGLPALTSALNCRAPERPSGVTAGCWRAFIV